MTTVTATKRGLRRTARACSPSVCGPSVSAPACSRGRHGGVSSSACSGTVTTARIPASTTKVPRQPSGPTSAAVSGAKTVLENPATRVSVVSARTRCSPYQPVIAANAGG